MYFDFYLLYSFSPEIGVHGFTVANFSGSVSDGVDLSRFSMGRDVNDPLSSNWSNKTSLKFEVCCNFSLLSRPFKHSFVNLFL